jgi:GNAT superfamily N-acetyltransferase
MFKNTLAMLEQASAYFRAQISSGPTAIRVGPFWIQYDADDDNPFRNYAFPDEGATIEQADIDELLRHFMAINRIPRFEYLPALVPSLAGALLRLGFAEERSTPLMAADPGSFDPTPRSSGVTYRLAKSKTDFAAAAQLQNLAYEAGAATDIDVKRLQGTAHRGGGVAIAEIEDSVAGSGLFTAPKAGMSEIAAVGVAPLFRRRGIGGDMVSFLVATAMQTGVNIPFLMAAGDMEARIYEGRGLRSFGNVLHISRRT